MITVVITYFLNIFIGFMQFLIAGTCTKCKCTVIRTAVCSIALLSLYSVFSYNSSYWILIPVYVVLFAALQSLTMKVNIQKSLILSCVVFVISTIIDYIFVAVANVLTPKAFNDLASFQNTIAANISKLLCLFVWIVLYILVRKFKDNIQNFIDNNRTLRVVGQNFIFLFFFSLPNFNIFLNMFLGEVDSKDVYNAVLVVVFIVYSFINVYKQIANVSKEYEQEIQAQQVVLMRNSIDKTRDFRHNFRNTMNIINGYVELGDLDNLRDYMSGLSSEIWSVKTADNIHANLKKIPHLYGLFKDKLAMSEERRVAFELDINLQDEMISRLVPNDLSKIMGILLDNAIEAAEESKGKFVAVSIDRVMKHTSIRITNTYLNKPDPEQIIKDGYTTKKDHTGFGLYEVESIIKKYQDKREKVSITYNCDDAYFIITLNI